MTTAEKPSHTTNVGGVPKTQVTLSETAIAGHNDEAVKVLEAYRGDETWTEAEEKKLRKKLDWRLLPVLGSTYALQYYDKGMLSQAVRRP